MAITDNENSMVMPVQPMGYGYGSCNNGGLFGGCGNDSWLGILFLIALLNGGWGGFGGFGGGVGGFAADGAMLYPWMNQADITTRGFQNQATNSAVNSLQNSVTSGFGDIQTALCGSFAGVNQNVMSGTAAIQNSLCNGFNSVNQGVNSAQNAITQQMYTNQISDLERSFAAQTATTNGLTNISAQLAQCCCDNRAATNDVKYTIATEACNTRAANTANTQAILDKLCQLELDGFKRENDQLRSQLQLANLQASQVAQTAELRANNATVANQLVSELRSCPIPSQPVYGNQPIFTCNSNVGCGCGA